MEGGVVDQVSRVLHHQLLYVRPSIDYVPAIYTPLYYYVSTLVASLTGLGFLPLRLVSVAASLGVLALIFVFIRRETGRWQYGLVAAGLFAATYRICGAWFDIARGDSLFLFFLLLGVYWLRFAEYRRQFVYSALAFWLAFLSKQTAIVITLPLLIYAGLAYRKRAIVFLVTYGASLGLTIWLMDLVHHGWFSYYVFELPARHQIDTSQYLGFWVNSILENAAGLALFSLGAVILFWSRGHRRRTIFYLAILSGALASSWSSLLHSGGYDNVLMPSMMALSLASVVLLASGSGPVADGPLRSQTSRVSIVLGVLLLAQFILLAYDPSKQIPSRSRTEAANEIIRAIAKTPGDVYMPYHGFLPSLAGKKTYAHQMALKDVIRADSAMANEISSELNVAYSAHRFSLVILDSPGSSPALSQNYVLTNQMPPAVMDYWPMTGLPTRPRFWYIPRSSSP